MDNEIQLDWDATQQLLSLIVGLVQKYKEEGSVQPYAIAEQVAAAFGIADVEAFATEKLESLVGQGFADAFGSEEAAQQLALIFSGGCAPVVKHIASYAKGEIKPAELFRAIDELYATSAGAIQSLLQNVLHIPPEAGEALTQQFGPYTVSVFCFLATAMIYRRAAVDAALARKRRLEAERLAQEAVQRLRAERAEMEELVSSYLLDRLLPFSAGVEAMDQAVLDNDDDGFVRANAELWELFGRKAQYRNAQEFDELMLSDEAFRL